MSSDEYSKLKKIWYDRLKEFGFEEIEQENGMLKAWHSRRFLGLNRANVDNQTATHEYHYYANHFLNEHQFEKEIHKIMWEMHVNGKGVKAIAKELNNTGAYSTDHNEVWKIIKHYQIPFREYLKKAFAGTSGDYSR